MQPREQSEAILTHGTFRLGLAELLAKTEEVKAQGQQSPGGTAGIVQSDVAGALGLEGSWSLGPGAGEGVNTPASIQAAWPPRECIQEAQPREHPPVRGSQEKPPDSDTAPPVPSLRDKPSVAEPSMAPNSPGVRHPA